MSPDLPRYYRDTDGGLKEFPALKSEGKQSRSGKKLSITEGRVSQKWDVWSWAGQELPYRQSHTHLLVELKAATPIFHQVRQKDGSELVDADLVEAILSAQRFSDISCESERSADILRVEIKKRIFSVLADIARSAVFNGEKQVLVARLVEVGRAKWIDDDFALRLANDLNVPIGDIGEIAKTIASRLWGIAQQAAVSSAWGQLLASGRELRLLPAPLSGDDFESWPE